MVGIELEKLKMAPDRRAVRLAAVRVKAHYAIFQLAFKVNAIGLAVDPILHPYFFGGIVMVEALAHASSARPVFQQHALINDGLNAAGSNRTVALRGNNVPFSNPEIKLAIFRMMSAWVRNGVRLFNDRFIG